MISIPQFLCLHNDFSHTIRYGNGNFPFLHPQALKLNNLLCSQSLGLWKENRTTANYFLWPNISKFNHLPIKLTKYYEIEKKDKNLPFLLNSLIQCHLSTKIRNSQMYFARLTQNSTNVFLHNSQIYCCTRIYPDFFIPKNFLDKILWFQLSYLTDQHRQTNATEHQYFLLEKVHLS